MISDFFFRFRNYWKYFIDFSKKKSQRGERFKKKKIENLLNYFDFFTKNLFYCWCFKLSTFEINNNDWLSRSFDVEVLFFSLFLWCFFLIKFFVIKFFVPFPHKNQLKNNKNNSFPRILIRILKQFEN